MYINKYMDTNTDYFTLKITPNGYWLSIHKMETCNWRASEVSETPSIANYRKKCCVYSTYVKTTMRMLTILREAEEWTRVHLREVCLLFASAITKSSLYVRQNDKAHAHQITLLSLAP